MTEPSSAHPPAAPSSSPLTPLAFLRSLYSFVRPHWLYGALILPLLVLQAVSHLVTPLYYKLVFDHAIGQGDSHFLGLLLAGMAAIFVLRSLAELLQSSLSATLGMHVANTIRLALFEHLQRLSIGFYVHAEAGDLLARFTGDLHTIERVVTVSLYKAILYGLVAVLCIGALFLLEWRLALFTLVMVPVITLIPKIFTTRATRANYARRQTENTGECCWEAEQHRLQDELLLQARADESQAETCFRHALEIARHQQAKSLELRAAMSLGRLWQRRGAKDEARRVLAESYGWFTEGFDTADLRDARALLEALS